MMRTTCTWGKWGIKLNNDTKWAQKSKICGVNNNFRENAKKKIFVSTLVFGLKGPCHEMLIYFFNLRNVKLVKRHIGEMSQ
jgi:hypothetical protein